MSQPATWGVPLVSPATPTVYATRDDDSLDALLSLHSGTSRPSYAVSGTMWKDVVSATVENIYFFDGTDDILLCTINPTANTVLFSGVVTPASVTTFTNKTIDANGTGNSISNIDVADLADGTDGELITWGATGAPATVGVGTAAQLLTSNGPGAAPTFQDAVSATGWDFTSAEQSLTTATKITIAHSLGAIPTKTELILRCKITESNWAVGDEIFLGTIVNNGNSSGQIISADATNVYISQGNDAQWNNIFDKNTGTTFNLTEANWRYEARASL